MRFIHARSLTALCSTLLTFFVVSTTSTTNAAISLTLSGAAYTQNFDTLSNTVAGSSVPPFWAFSESGTSTANDGLYAVGTGSSGTGDTYSFGAAASTERAFGTLLSGTIASIIGAEFSNDIGNTITSVAISYTGEEWRLGTAARTDRLDFQYSLNATSLTTGTWTDVDLLDFNTPNTVTPLGAKNGNDAAFRTAISNTISPLSILSGTTFWIRWTDFNASSADDGLAVDDFSLTPTAQSTGVVPETATVLVWAALCGSVLVGWRRWQPLI